MADAVNEVVKKEEWNKQESTDVNELVKEERKEEKRVDKGAIAGAVVGGVLGLLKCAMKGSAMFAGGLAPGILMVALVTGLFALLGANLPNESLLGWFGLGHLAFC